MQTITPQELKNRINQGDCPVIVDVREPEETAEGIIPGAVTIPLMQLPEQLDRIPKDKETVLVCRSGNRSGRACEYLASLGYTQIKNMTGGMLEWEKL